MTSSNPYKTKLGKLKPGKLKPHKPINGVPYGLPPSAINLWLKKNQN